MATTRDSRVRRAGVVTALVTLAVLAWPGAAYAADVTITPTEARQGEAVKLEFVVPEDRAGTRTERIEVRLPVDAPIAEVYPMSVDGWAPRIDSRVLDTPVAGIHSTTVGMVTSAVTWVRMPGSAAGPARLTLSMGPLPRADRLAFEVLQTYADGTVVRRSGPAGPALTLLPGAPGAVAGHGHGAAPAAPQAATDDGSGDGGSPQGLLVAGLLAGLGGGVAGGWALSRWRRRESPDGRDDLRAVLDGPTPAGDGDAATGRTDDTGGTDDTAGTTHRTPAGTSAGTGATEGTGTSSATTGTDDATGVAAARQEPAPAR
ncbi:DUF1775 domain-containing protein [Micromonospora endolithica]|uniref:DUF1775 domain-containing protein n=1 Tax=Micromonospora endolithica TaxID=230091 RepID=A0A3A9YTW3_9ACTN|nr:DUF1775 domain-containing protein [Micromonospora endolithica]RKN39400.1 DUF1775 domain-containing protein [Micromonospora endolithica]TWJ22668.1 uncharacterized protein DUF1775 [Micromonospora endolithica]